MIHPLLSVTITGNFIIAVLVDTNSATHGSKFVMTALDNLQEHFASEVVAVGFHLRDLGTGETTTPIIITTLKNGIETEFSFPLDISDPLLTKW
jgi:hypothetical protein